MVEGVRLVAQNKKDIDAGIYISNRLLKSGFNLIKLINQINLKEEAMKIKAIKTFPYDGVWRDLIFIKVETDEGIYGWGEAGTMGRDRANEATIHEIEHYLIGKDPGQIELHWNTLYRDSYWRPDYTLLNALAGVEMALWDILGKSLDVPVYKLLGGEFHSRIPVYNNAWYFSPTSRAKTLEDYGKLAKKAVAQGFKHLKWDPWWDPGTDYFIGKKDMRWAKECVKIVREAVGSDIELLIEMHGRFSPEDAIQAARELEEYNPYFIEEPICPDCSVDALARVRNSTRIPVAAGERVLTRWGFWEVFEKQAVAIAQPDIVHCGGISEMKKIAAMAQVSYVGFAPHISEGPVEVASLVHIDASTPNLLIQEFFYPDMPLYETIMKDPFPVPKDGFIELPTKPGLGVELDEKALTGKPFKYRPGLVLGGLWGEGLRTFAQR